MGVMESVIPMKRKRDCSGGVGAEEVSQRGRRQEALRQRRRLHSPPLLLAASRARINSGDTVQAHLDKGMIKGVGAQRAIFAVVSLRR